MRDQLLQSPFSSKTLRIIIAHTALLVWRESCCCSHALWAKLMHLCNSLTTRKCTC